MDRRTNMAVRKHNAHSFIRLWQWAWTAATIETYVYRQHERKAVLRGSRSHPRTLGRGPQWPSSQ
jgi:hypothetical protein